MTAVECAARAIWEASGRPLKAQDTTPGEGGLDPEAGWESFLPHARAALQAIREPSDEMIEAGAEIVRNVHVEETEQAFASDAANTWRFMIDAALTGR